MEPVEEDDSEYIRQHDSQVRIRLEQYLKAFNIASSGGQAKMLIQSGQVRVNGIVETRRKRQLDSGDVIEFLSTRWIVST